MNAQFRLYERDGSANTATIFDLIVGSGNEPRQTKALGYVFSRSEILLRRFLKEDSVSRMLHAATGRRRPKFDQYIVDAEMLGADQQGSVRADLVIRFFHQSIPQFALLIEAKTAKKAGAGDEAVIGQVRRYLSGGIFGSLDAIPIVPVALTRSRRVLGDIASVTWNDLRELVHENAKRDPLLFEFRQFLQRTGDDMHFYEREILSVPAGGTAEAVERTCIHGCPDTSSYSYKVPLRIAFRQESGIMRRLYKVLDIISFDPLDPVARQSALESSLEADEKDRLRRYLEARDHGFGWGNWGEPFRFYILDTEDIIDLPHGPRPPNNTPRQLYFRLCDVLDRNKEVVDPVS